jgi:hypothetical protein
MSNKWNEDLRRRMEQYEAPAPDDLFDDIMSALPAEAPTTPVARLWPRRIAIAAAVVIAIAAGYLTLTTPMPIADDVVAEAEPATENSYLPLSAPAMEQESLLADATAEKIPQPKLRTGQHIAQKQLTPSIDLTPEPNSQTMAMESKAEEQSSPEEPTIERKNDSQRSAQPRATQSRAAQPAQERVLAMATRNRSERLSMGLHTAGITIGENNQSTQQVFTVNSALHGVRHDDIEDDEATDVLLHDQERTISSRRHHRLPVRVGVTLRYNLSDRWAIESGVAYTKLSSENSLGDSANYYDERTTLHYIGLPVNAVYNIYHSPRFVVYASAGVMAEKAVSGDMRTDYFLNGERINSMTSDVRIKPLQWSVNAAAGVQYNLSRWVALYAEPSIGYHFDNGTAIETLYNERPLDFNLGVGLRFTLR